MHRLTFTQAGDNDAGLLMSKRAGCRDCFSKLVGFLLSLLGLILGGQPASAQEVTTLIQFTNIWKYNDTGIDLGTAWQTNDYDDSAWPSGLGLLGYEPDTPAIYTIHAPINTPVTISSTTTTFYFRAVF